MQADRQMSDCMTEGCVLSRNKKGLNRGSGMENIIGFNWFKIKSTTNHTWTSLDSNKNISNELLEFGQ